MKVDIVTLFPEMLSGPLDESILKRAREKGLVEIRLHGLRDFTRDKHKICLLYTSPSPRDYAASRMPSSA